VKHHLTLAQYVILGAFGLFLIFMLFFSIDGEFAGRATTGTTVNISESVVANCSFVIGPGYNLISLPCLTTAESLDTVVGGTPVRVMYQYVPGASDSWKVYNPDLPNYVVSDLQFLTRRAGYIVLANGTSNKTVEGRRIGFTEVPIVAGWNLVGYPAFTVRNVSDAFDSINSSYSVVIGYNKTAEQFATYANPSGGDLEVVTPGEGYWVNGTAAASWMVLS
jgi:hypothetical protein